MSIVVDPYLVARDAIRSIENLSHLNQLEEEVRRRHAAIVSGARWSLFKGDTVLYIGTRNSHGLVSNVSKGVVEKVNRTRVEVRFDVYTNFGVQPRVLSCPIGIIQKVQEDEVKMPETQSVNQEPPEAAAEDLAWMLGEEAS